MVPVTSALTESAKATISLAHNTRLQEVAKDLEASFLAEMLKEAGFGKAREALGGGAGEEHFASFMVEAHAKKIVERGGIGLAESIFQALKEKQNDQIQPK